jgi:hypothetical protein
MGDSNNYTIPTVVACYVLLGFFKTSIIKKSNLNCNGVWTVPQTLEDFATRMKAVGTALYSKQSCELGLLKSDPFWDNGPCFEWHIKNA